TATAPVQAEEAAPEKLSPVTEQPAAPVPTQLEGLPEVKQTSRPSGSAEATPDKAGQQASETPAAPDIKAETKETAPEKVTEEKGVEVAPQPKVAETATTEFRIQLGAVKTEELAKTEWARMTAKHGAALKGLELHYSPVNLGDKGTYLRIQTSTLTREDAE